MKSRAAQRHRRLRLQVTNNLPDRAILWSEHEVVVIRQDRRGMDVVTAFSRGLSKTVGDDVDLFIGEDDWWILKCGLCRQPQRAIVRDASDGLPRVDLCCRTVTKEFPRPHEVRP